MVEHNVAVLGGPDTKKYDFSDYEWEQDDTTDAMRDILDVMPPLSKLERNRVRSMLTQMTWRST